MKSRLTVRSERTDKAIAFKDSVRILGVTFDRRLSFFLHADALKANLATLLTCLNTLARLQGGRLRPEQKTTQYINVILLAIAYTSPIWWDELCRDCTLKSRIVSIQRSVLLNLSEAFHTTRTAALQVFLRAPPIVLELKWLNAKFRLFALQKMTRYGGLIVHPDEITYPVDRLAIHPAKRASFPYHRIKAREATWIAGSPGLHVGTDSSYAEELAGAAYVVFDRANRVEALERFSVSRATSALCAEAMALADALTWLKAHPPSQDVFVYMDCLSLLQAISSRTNTDPQIVEMQHMIVNIALKANVRLYYVPGHCRVFGNEDAQAASPLSTLYGRGLEPRGRGRSIHAGARWIH
ncbi:hypothetical protein MRX96_046358 [Rhipicephalus microplus]